MPQSSPEDAQPPAWKPVHKFRIPIRLEDLQPVEREALQAFLGNVALALRDLSSAYRFDEKGCLQNRMIDRRDDATCCLHFGSSTFRTVRNQFAALGVAPPPPIFSVQPPSASQVEAERTSGRSAILSWVFALRAQPPVMDPSLSEPDVREKLIEAQFVLLQEWISERYADGSLVPAILIWSNQVQVEKKRIQSLPPEPAETSRACAAVIQELQDRLRFSVGIWHQELRQEPSSFKQLETEIHQMFQLSANRLIDTLKDALIPPSEDPKTTPS